MVMGMCFRFIKRIHLVVFIFIFGFAFLALHGCSNTHRERADSAISEPLAESQIIDLSVESAIMERKMPVRIYLPNGYGAGKKYPVWYGLHGSSSSETMWTNAGITEIADKLVEDNEIQPMIMVFPFVKDDALKEFNKQMKEYGKLGERYIDQYISKELIPYIDANFDTIASAKSRYIGGFSMGGMMSLRIAFQHPDLFSKVSGYSAAVPSSDYSGTQLEKWLFPDENTDEIENTEKYARKKGLNKLQIYLEWSNENEPFSVGLQSLCEALEKRKIKVEYKVNDSGHNLVPQNFADYLKYFSGD